MTPDEAISWIRREIEGKRSIFGEQETATVGIPRKVAEAIVGRKNKKAADPKAGG